MYPCRLTLLVLPVQQMLAIATLADCARRTAAVYGASWGLRFKLQARSTWGAPPAAHISALQQR